MSLGNWTSSYWGVPLAVSVHTMPPGGVSLASALSTRMYLVAATDDLAITQERVVPSLDMCPMTLMAAPEGPAAANAFSHVSRYPALPSASRSTVYSAVAL